MDADLEITDAIKGDIAEALERAGYDKPWLVRERAQDWQRHDDSSVTFEIERHGGTVQGSVYAEVHRFRYADGEIELYAQGKRQVNPRNPSVTKAECERVARDYRAALDRGDLPPGTRRAKKDGRLLISFTKVAEAQFGSAPRQTLQGRLRRLREAFQGEGLLLGDNRRE